MVKRTVCLCGQASCRAILSMLKCGCSPPSESARMLDVIVLAGRPAPPPPDRGCTEKDPPSGVRFWLGRAKAAADVDSRPCPGGPCPCYPGVGCPRGREEQDGWHQATPAPPPMRAEPAPAALGCGPGGLWSQGFLHPLRGGEEGRPSEGSRAPASPEALDQLLAEVASEAGRGPPHRSGGHGHGEGLMSPSQRSTAAGRAAGSPAARKKAAHTT